jgi:hypothetical protein
VAKAVKTAFKWIFGLGVARALFKTVIRALTPKLPEVDNSQAINFRADPDAGIPYVIGRTGTAGIYTYATVGEAKNRNLLFHVVISGGGPIDSFVDFKMGGVSVTFDGADTPNSGPYRHLVWQRRQLGTTPQTYLQPPNTTDSGVLSEWDSTHATSGYATAWYVLGSSPTVYASGVPDPLWIVRGVKCYDWRLDSTYPGGSGSHRLATPSTWTFSENPAVHAVAWLLGRYANGKKVLGLGATLSQIAMDKYTEWANICDANAWKVGGVVYSTDTKWQILKAICQAGGAYPTALGSKISVIFNAPRVSIATLTGADVDGEPTIVGTQSRRDRFNRAVPRFRSEAHGWKVVPATPISVSSFITEDGGQRTKELEWPLVQNVDQAAQLAMYGICNSREIGPIDLPVIPRWMGLEPGDCITLNEAEFGVTSQKMVVSARTRSLSSFGHALTCVTETDSKHAFCLGQTGVAPPLPSLTAVDVFPPAPTSGIWTGVGTTIASATGAVPAIVITGVLEDANAGAVLVDYRQITPSVGLWATQEWPISALQVVSGSPSLRLPLTGLAPGAEYEVRIRYRTLRGREDPNAYRSLGTLTAGTLSAAEAAIAASIIGQTAWATYTASISSIATPGANLVFDGGLKLKGKGWTLGSWTAYAASSDVGPFISCSTSNVYSTSPRFAVDVGGVYTVQAWAASAVGTYSNTPKIYIAWYNSSDGYISETAQTAIPADGVYARRTASGTAPAGAVYGRVAFYSGFHAGGLSVYVSKVKCEKGSAASVWSDETTSGALYANGINIDDLKPQEIGANVTESRTASAVTGQTAWATYLGLTPGQLSNPAANLLKNPTFSLGLENWTAAGTWLTTITTEFGWVAYTTDPAATLRQDFPAYPGAVFSVSADLNPEGLATGAMRLYIQWLNSGGGSIGYSTVATLAAGTPRTRLKNANQLAPAGAAVARVYVDAFASTLYGGSNIWAGRVKLEFNSVCTPYSDEATQADFTSTHTASGIAGQGTLATANEVAWATQVTGVGKPESDATKSYVYRQVSAPSGAGLNDVWYQTDGSGVPYRVFAWNGTTWQLGADITGLNTASGISGQSPLATQTPPTHAGTAAALTAGLAAGASYLDSTDSNKLKTVVGAATAPVATLAQLAVSDSIPYSGTTQTTLQTVAMSTSVPAGGKFRITAALLNTAGDGVEFSFFNIRVKINYGGTETQLSSSLVSIDPDGVASDDTLRSLSSMLVSNPGSGAANVLVTRARGGGVGSGGGDYDVNVLVEWVNA